MGTFDRFLEGLSKEQSFANITSTSNRTIFVCAYYGMGNRVNESLNNLFKILFPNEL